MKSNKSAGASAASAHAGGESPNHAAMPAAMLPVLACKQAASLGVSIKPGRRMQGSDDTIFRSVVSIEGKQLYTLYNPGHGAGTFVEALDSALTVEQLNDRMLQVFDRLVQVPHLVQGVKAVKAYVADFLAANKSAVGASSTGSQELAPQANAAVAAAAASELARDFKTALDLLEELDNAQREVDRLKRLAKKKILFTLTEEQPGEIYILDTVSAERANQHLAMRYKPGAFRLLNDLVS